jgi:hypothetical protein
LRNRQSLINWGIVLALLFGAGVLTIAWPAFVGNFGDSATQPIPTGPESIVIPLPIPIAGRSELVFTSWQLMGIIAFLVIGAVVTGGIVLAVINWILSRIVANTKQDPEYQQDVAALERSTTAEIKQMRETRPTSTSSEVRWQRWAVATTSAAILMFVAFFGLLIANSLFPEGYIIWQDTLVNITAIITLILLAIALVVLILAYRSRRRRPAAAVDSSGIPWDTIAVLISGLLVVGIGIGVLLLLNSPS